MDKNLAFLLFGTPVVRTTKTSLTTLIGRHWFFTRLTVNDLLITFETIHVHKWTLLSFLMRFTFTVLKTVREQLISAEHYTKIVQFRKTNVYDAPIRFRDYFIPTISVPWAFFRREGTNCRICVLFNPEKIVFSLIEIIWHSLGP